MLLEILDDCYSDPPVVPIYTMEVDRDKSVLKNKYAMEIIECLGVKNRQRISSKVKFPHLEVAQVEISNCVLVEQRHHDNHTCVERRQLGFPIIGHYDTWLIDKL